MLITPSLYFSYGEETWNEEFKKGIREVVREVSAKTGESDNNLTHQNINIDEVTSIEVSISNWDKKLSVKVFECDSNGIVTYCCGQGLYSEQIAVYKKVFVPYTVVNDFFAFGIIQNETETVKPA